ncbi:MAG: elongation factor P hydroxylase [Gammaproteobacteria bacterium]|nr:elongation factor P hydroxylase [Gammaproteobacteria bacterium]
MSEYNTQLVQGDDEPLYLPAHAACSYHAIYFAHGFFSSALHECAHWFIAGPKRRQQIDYGYWYEPDGRSAEQQALFQAQEIKPQAIEWMLSDAAGYRFQPSTDNLNGVTPDTEAFKKQLAQQVMRYEQDGLPPRAEQFRLALVDFYKSNTISSAAGRKLYEELIQCP